MCGLVGIWSPEPRRDFPTFKTLVTALARLEYRGYDSVGLAFQVGEDVRVFRQVGALKDLKNDLELNWKPEDWRWIDSATVALGHTRWATHGQVTETNAHPHRGGSVSIAVNGIIENDRALRRRLERNGVQLQSQTDSELLAHLLDEYLEVETFPMAMRHVLHETSGMLAALFLRQGGNQLAGFRRGAPLVLGKNTDGTRFMAASDTLGMAGFVDQVCYLEDGTCFVVNAQGVQAWSQDGERVELKFQPLPQHPEEADRGPFPHFMLKEIHEQPDALLRTFSPWVDLSAGRLRSLLHESVASRIAGLRQILIIGCGTAYHAGLLGKYLIQKETDLWVDCQLASEFRYGKMKINPTETLCVAISQSGETADTLAAVRKLRSEGVFVLGVTNSPQSTLAREVNQVLQTLCGPEIGVASTKAFTAQLLVMHLLAKSLSKSRGQLSVDDEERFIQLLSKIPTLVRDTISRVESQHAKMSSWLHRKTYLFIGRNVLYPLALEGALKLKELAYVHAEGYAAGELKHGPIALVDSETLCFVFQGWEHLEQKTLSNMEEVRARGGQVVFLGQGFDHGEFEGIELPKSDPEIAIYPHAIPCQLIAYVLSRTLGLNPDRPRNLAKSVTVE